VGRDVIVQQIKDLTDLDHFPAARCGVFGAFGQLAGYS
jgi:hypothetical protein